MTDTLALAASKVSTARCQPWAAATLGLFMALPDAAVAQIDAVGGERLQVTLRRPETKEVAAFKGGEPILMDFVLTNPSPSPVRVLVWRTPFRGVTDNIFVVASGRTDQAGGRGVVGYIGPIVKRGPPQPDDFIELAPGASRRATVNLADSYAIYQQGDYSVTLRPAPAPDIPPAIDPLSMSPLTDGLRKLAVQSNAFAFSVVEARQPKLALAPAPGDLVQPFDGCTAAQQPPLQDAIRSATELSARVAKLLRDTLDAQQPNSARYKTWFGAHTAQRYATAREHFNKIENAFSTRPIVIGCSGDHCTSSTFAYVFPTQPYKIYVCQAFWNAAIDGTDSRTGTLIHEMSHFDVVGGTDDVVYGQSAAKALAASNPDAAISNADNHEYFSENTPNLPM
jgi:peptidyl-Lys metalloendopeptidase